jgi:hypothetical protein
MSQEVKKLESEMKNVKLDGGPYKKGDLVELHAFAGPVRYEGTYRVTEVHSYPGGFLCRYDLVDTDYEQDKSLKKG